jgi:hypothetical protein
MPHGNKSLQVQSCDFRVKSTPSIHPDRLANFGILHQPNLAQLNIGSTLLSFTLPLLMLRSALIICNHVILCSGSLRLDQARSGLAMMKFLVPQAAHAPLCFGADPDSGPDSSPLDCLLSSAAQTSAILRST